MSNKSAKEFINKQDPYKFETDYVTNVYNSIAPHFSSTRYKPWPFVEAFLKKLPDNSIVGDIGCGNGKYMNVNPKIFTIGSDVSEAFAIICNTRGYECIVCDNLHLPFRKNSFDYIISVAVIHHFSTEERRLQSIKELVKSVKVGGQILITVWAFEQEDEKTGKRKYTEQDVFVPWHLQKRWQTPADRQKKLDTEISSKGEIIFKRYYHLFKEGELSALCSQIPNIKILTVNYEKGNWGIILEKIGND